MDTTPTDPQSEANHLSQIQHLRHEIITDKSSSYHDALFKIIIIGDTGKVHHLSLRNFNVLTFWQASASHACSSGWWRTNSRKTTTSRWAWSSARFSSGSRTKF